MLNPFLARRIFEFPVRPVLVEVQPEFLDRVVSALGGPGLTLRNIITQFSMIGLVAVPSKLIPVIESLPGVRMVHADLQVNTLELPATADWWLTSESRKVLEAESAFKDGWTGEAVRLAVIDTGVDPSHPQLVGAEWHSVITIPREPGLDAGPQASGHGSHVASTAAGKYHMAETGPFVEGVSRAQVFSIQALGRVVGTGFTSEVVNAMALALESGARVVNMSLGSQECQGGCEVCPQCRAVKQLADRGVLVAVAAGNSGPDPDTIGCPGCAPQAITVAAVDRSGQVASFSSRGGSKFPSKPDVAAPGVNIFSGTGRGSQVDLGDPTAGFGYAAISGTSMATPHIAGLLALLRHRTPGMTPEQFKAVIQVRGQTFDNALGWGVPKWAWFRT